MSKLRAVILHSASAKSATKWPFSCLRMEGCAGRWCSRRWECGFRMSSRDRVRCLRSRWRWSRCRKRQGSGNRDQGSKTRDQGTGMQELETPLAQKVPRTMLEARMEAVLAELEKDAGAAVGDGAAGTSGVAEAVVLPAGGEARGRGLLSGRGRPVADQGRCCAAWDGWQRRRWRIRRARKENGGRGSAMARQRTMREMLAPGRRLDRGNACEVAALLLKNPRKTGQVVECLWDEDTGVANRAADALERASGRRPEILRRWKEALLGPDAGRRREQAALEPGADDLPNAADMRPKRHGPRRCCARGSTIKARL